MRPTSRESGTRPAANERHSMTTNWARVATWFGAKQFGETPLVTPRFFAQATGSAWHRVWSAETRIKWCRSRAGKIGEQLAGGLIKASKLKSRDALKRFG